MTDRPTDRPGQTGSYGSFTCNTMYCKYAFSFSKVDTQRPKYKVFKLLHNYVHERFPVLFFFFYSPRKSQINKWFWLKTVFLIISGDILKKAAAAGGKAYHPIHLFCAFLNWPFSSTPYVCHHFNHLLGSSVTPAACFVYASLFVFKCGSSFITNHFPQSNTSSLTEFRIDLVLHRT